MHFIAGVLRDRRQAYAGECHNEAHGYLPVGGGVLQPSWVDVLDRLCGPVNFKMFRYDLPLSAWWVLAGTAGRSTDWYQIRSWQLVDLSGIVRPF